MDETPRASDLQVQVEQVNLALRQLRQTQESIGSLETRLTEMTRECADILDRWARNDERHATAVVELHSRLGEWNDIERRLLSESTTRIHQFERSLQHEWQGIRQSHEEPLRQVEAQTTRVTDACLTAVSQALQGFERAESRLAGIEQDLQRQFGELAIQVREALAEIRPAAAGAGPRQPWSLDNVVKLHNELRAETPLAGAARGPLALSEPRGAEPVTAPARARWPEPNGAAAAADEPPAPSTSRRFWIATAVIAMSVAMVAFLSGKVQSGLREATARADAAERGAQAAQSRASEADRQRQQAEADAARRLQEAQQASRAAEGMARVAAAPDLFRFPVAARQGTGRALVLWSRAEGVAVTASDLPAPPDGQAYQLWLLSPGTATSVGMLAVDGDGRASQVFEPPARLPRPIVRAMVTLEPSAGSPTPTAPAVLVAPRPPAESR